jgi:hypothetical protein
MDAIDRGQRDPLLSPKFLALEESARRHEREWRAEWQQAHGADYPEDEDDLLTLLARCGLPENTRRTLGCGNCQNRAATPL